MSGNLKYKKILVEKDFSVLQMNSIYSVLVVVYIFLGLVVTKGVSGLQLIGNSRAPET